MTSDPNDRYEEAFGSDIPELEDATDVPKAADVVEDDETEVELDVAARSLTGDESDEAEDVSAQPDGSEELLGEIDDLSDVAHISDEPVETLTARTPRRVGEWELEPSAHNVVVELKRIENEVRELLEGVDSRRKRRLGGTQRWHELEEDIIGWKFGGRVPEDSLRRLQELVTRRHFLFRHLEFLAATRPVLNS